MAASLRPHSDPAFASILLERVSGVSGFSQGQAAVASIILDRIIDRVGLRRAGSEPTLDGQYFNAYGKLLPQWLNGAARIMRKEVAPAARYALDVDAGSALFRQGRMREVVPLNAATEQVLAQVPGLTRAAVRHLLTKRPPNGYANDDEARRASGLTRAAWEEVSKFLYVAPIGLPYETATPTPFRTLLEELVSGERELPGLNPGATEQDVVIELLRACGRILSERSHVPPYWGVGARRMYLTSRGVAGLEPLVPVRHVALLRNATYLDALRELLSRARRRIIVSMFFYTVEEDTPGAEWLSLLTQAKRRGLDVRVLLSDGLPGSVHGAQRINKEALKALEVAGISVRRYWPEITLHRKLVVIDDLRVLCGSHNWTTSSAFRYDETSVLVESELLAERLTAEFENDWAMLAPRRNERKIPVDALEQIPATVRNALTAASISAIDRLPTNAARLRELARDTDCKVAELRWWRDVARLMQRLRVAEITATALLAAGVRPDARFGPRMRERARRAFGDTSDLPVPLRDRRLDPGVGAYVAEKMK